MITNLGAFMQNVLGQSASIKTDSRMVPPFAALPISSASLAGSVQFGITWAPD